MVNLDEQIFRLQEAFFNHNSTPAIRNQNTLMRQLFCYFLVKNWNANRENIKNNFTVNSASYIDYLISAYKHKEHKLYFDFKNLMLADKVDTKNSTLLMLLKKAQAAEIKRESNQAWQDTVLHNQCLGKGVYME